MKTITNWEVQEHHPFPLTPATIITADIDGVKRKITINWKLSTLIVSASNPAEGFDDVHEFDLPNTDLLQFLSENMR